MKSVVYLTQASDLDLWQRSGVTDVILAVKDFSRSGTLSFEEAINLNEKATALGLNVSFDWDALMEEPRFLMLSKKLKDHFPFKACRVRDAGAVVWVRENLNCDIHLLLESGHHNLKAIESWQKRLGARLKRVALSPELPQATIKLWKPQLGLEIEILGLGPLLLFHSPRPLLSTLTSDKKEEWIAEGASEESPHKGFPLRENSHGTLMYHPKDLSIIERWNEMREVGIDYVRFDHRQQKSHAIVGLLATFISHPVESTRNTLKENWDREWMRGYWDVNKSDVLFDKLKNQNLSHSSRQCAVVLEGKKDSWLAIKVTGLKLNPQSQIEVMNPQGKSKTIKLHWLKNDAFQNVEELQMGEIGFIPWISGSPSKTKISLV
ncbi:MAG: U32 family peptidase [Bacteriovoracaceae bacterium]|nr:U32 family peptidase [Bacteriovoracaceae bacterium]